MRLTRCMIHSIVALELGLGVVPASERSTSAVGSRLTCMSATVDLVRSNWHSGCCSNAFQSGIVSNLIREANGVLFRSRAKRQNVTLSAIALICTA